MTKKYIFHTKTQLFVMAQSHWNLDLDPHGSTLVWLPESESGCGFGLRQKVDLDPP
jgi:hypothetical protein